MRTRPRWRAFIPTMRQVRFNALRWLEPLAPGVCDYLSVCTRTAKFEDLAGGEVISLRDVAEEPLPPYLMKLYTEDFEAEHRREGHVPSSSEWRWRYGVMNDVHIYCHSGQVVDTSKFRSLTPVHHGTTKPRRLVVRYQEGLTVNFLPAPRHYYHYMFEYLPKCLSILQILGKWREPVTILLPEEGEQFGDIVLNEIKSRYPRILVVRVSEREKVHCTRLLHFRLEYSSKFRLPASRASLKMVSAAVRRYHKVAEVNSDTDCRQKIYISRSDTKTRRIVNESDLIRKLSPLGFNVVVPGRLTVKEQAETFQNAGLIVGTHGNGLTNLMFAPQGATVIELFGSNFVHGAYAWLAHLQGLGYGHVVSEKWGSDSVQDFRVSEKNIGLICEHIQRHCARSH